MNAATPDSALSFAALLVRHMLGPLAPLLTDDAVSEIMINGPDAIYIERAGVVSRFASDEGAPVFEDAEALRALARAMLQISGKRLTPTDLSLEARLFDGSRVHIVQDPAARPQSDDKAALRPGLCIAIRRFPGNPLTARDLISKGALSADAARYLSDAVASRRNLIVSGGTGSGKTTLLNVLSEMMGEQERIIVIEDASELRIRREHVVQFEAQGPDAHGRGGITIRELLRAALRMRPDRIIIGECRGGEAFDMVQAMSTGHAGSLSTVHADNPAGAMRRLETLCMMADMGLPVAAIRRILADAVDIIVQVERSGGERRVTAIAEVTPSADGESVSVTPVFSRDADGALTRCSGAAPLAR